jgi:hypothetical protein
VRQIWHRGDERGACSLLEADSEGAAREIIGSLPLVEADDFSAQIQLRGSREFSALEENRRKPSRPTLEQKRLRNGTPAIRGPGIRSTANRVMSPNHLLC